MHASIGYNMAEIVSPEGRGDNYKRESLFYIRTFLDSSVDKAPACKAGDPGSSPIPTNNFLFQF